MNIQVPKKIEIAFYQSASPQSLREILYNRFALVQSDFFLPPDVLSSDAFESVETITNEVICNRTLAVIAHPIIKRKVELLDKGVSRKEYLTRLGAAFYYHNSDAEFFKS
jgi:hypothetical protein